jgi:DNA-directed RNA polymerase specialized sigma24 family protein
VWKTVVMERQAVTQMEGRDNQILATYGRFLRQTLERIWPPELGGAREELEQEACRQFGQALARETERGDLTLYRIAVTMTLETVRRFTQQHAAQAIAWIDPHDSAANPNVEQPDLARRIQAAMARLPNNRRRAVGLHLTGLTKPEMSELLGWSEAKVDKEIERGLRSLRAALHAAGIEYESD